MNFFWLCIIYIIFLNINGYSLYNRFAKHFQSRFQLFGASSFNNNNINNQYDQAPRSNIPSRYDTCKVLITGMIGTEPKEMYLSNGHYVQSFSLAIVGHFKPVHDWERYKPTETMWMNCEAWDELAKSNSIQIKKGKYIRGIGYYIFNKWIDKVTGEEKKMNKLRFTKFLSKEEFESIEMILSDIDDSNNNGSSDMLDDIDSDSSFSNDFPPMDDQEPKYNNNYSNNDNDNYNNNNSNKHMDNKPWKKNTNSNNIPIDKSVSESSTNYSNKKTIADNNNADVNSNINKVTPMIPPPTKKQDIPEKNWTSSSSWMTSNEEDTEDGNINEDSMPWWQ